MNLPFNHFQPTIQIISQQKKHITNINWTYRVIQGKVSLILTNIWMSFDELKKNRGFQHVPNMIAIEWKCFEFIRTFLSIG